MGKLNTEHNRYSTFQNYCYILGGIKKWMPIIIPCLVIWALGEGLLTFVWLYAAKLIITMIEFGTGNFKQMISIVLVAAGIECILMLMHQIGSKQTEGRTTFVRNNFMLFTMKKVVTMPYEMMENPKVLDAKRKGDSAILNMVEGVEGLVRRSAPLFGYFITMLVAAVILFQVNPFLVLFMFVLSAWRAWFSGKTAKWEKEEMIDPLIPTYRKEDYFDWVTKDFEYGKDIRLFSMKEPLLEKQGELHHTIYRAIQKQRSKWRNCYIKQQSIELIQEGAMYGLLLFSIIKYGMSVAEFTLYVGSIRSFNNAVSRFLQQIVDMNRDSLFICDFRTFLEYPEKEGMSAPRSNFRNDYERFMGSMDIDNTPIPVPEDGTYRFTFEEVSFRYPGREEYALRNLNLTLEAGKRLAVVGLNGAGKSTFIKLLCRLYEPTEGTIYMNGMDISTFSKKEYYKLIAPVFQNVECFAFPLAENVSMDVPGHTDKAKAKDCLEKAGLEEKIKELPKGVDTEIMKILKPEGIELSGGEKQKMALARALYKDAPVVVLDEPTSALDALAEYRSYMEFDQLIGNKTAVYISHRLSSTRFCQNIAMFANGSMIEYGTHESLMKRKGAYADMFALQAQYYKEEDKEALQLAYEG